MKTLVKPNNQNISQNIYNTTTSLGLASNMKLKRNSKLSTTFNPITSDRIPELQRPEININYKESTFAS